MELIEKFQNRDIVNTLANTLKEILNCEVDIFIQYLIENSDLIAIF